jgi:hypothetical protein
MVPSFFSLNQPDKQAFKRIYSSIPFPSNSALFRGKVDKLFRTGQDYALPKKSERTAATSMILAVFLTRSRRLIMFELMGIVFYSGV